MESYFTSRGLRLVVPLAMLLVIAPPAEATKVNPVYLHMGSGETTGFYYALGTMLCGLVNKGRAEHGVRCSLTDSEGSAENLEDIENARAELALVQMDTLSRFLAQTVEGKSGKKAVVSGNKRDDETRGKADSSPLRTLFSLHDELLHLAVRTNLEVASISQLPWHRFHLGTLGSGTAQTAQNVLTFLGANPEQISHGQYLPNFLLEDGLQSGKIDGVFLVSGLGSERLIKLATFFPMRFLPLEMFRLPVRQILPAYLHSATITGGVYPGNPNDIATFGIRSVLLARADVPESAIQLLVERVFKQLDRIKAFHPALANLKVEQMLADPLLPFHPAAARFYQQQGWLPALPPH